VPGQRWEVLFPQDQIKTVLRWQTGEPELLQKPNQHPLTEAIASSIPGQLVGGGQSQALPGSQVVPNPANKEEFTGNPSSEDLFFSFQGRASLKLPLAVDHFSCWWSGAGCSSLCCGAGHHRARVVRALAGGHRPGGQGVTEQPDHARFPLVCAW